MSKSTKKASSPVSKIAIIGMGPVGMILAVHLKEAGCKVAICDLDKIKINLIRQDGIHLEGTFDKHCYFEHIYTAISDLKELDLDLLIFCVKAHQMSHALEEAVALKSNKLRVISAQNGIDVEQMLSDVFGESQTLRMVINYAGNLNSPNNVRVTFFSPPNYIGSVDDSNSELAEQFSGWLNAVELQTKSVDSFEVLKRVWEKTILNSSLSAICGIGKLTMKEAMEIPDTVEIVEQVIIEAIEVAETEKIKFEDNFIRKCLRYLRKAGHHFPSLAVDLINKRPTEIDYFNGKIVEYGRKHYIRTPLNLSFTNMVNAITFLNLSAVLPASSDILKTKKENISSTVDVNSSKTSQASESYYLGIDLGSVYTKFSVIDGNGDIAFQSLLKTLNRDRVALKHVMDTIHSDFRIKYSCATGYGRKHFADAEIIKTEINCAAIGGSEYYPGAKTIIDIGGEDIKIIRCSERNTVDNFFLNSKCAAGTGAFITEIAERAELDISEMSHLAGKSHFNKELNSFCTVFAKTEIMGWLFDGVAKEDIAKGIYISIANRVAKLSIDTSVPIYLIGGVIAYHSYLKNLLEEKFQKEIQIIDRPIYVSSVGAALIAKKHLQNKSKKIEVEKVN
jgi:2-dehydropantoate 2-reductase